MILEFILMQILLVSIKVEGWPCSSTVLRTFSRVNTEAVLYFDVSEFVNEKTYNTFHVKFHDNTVIALVLYHGGDIRTDQLPGVNVSADMLGNVRITKVNVSKADAGTYIIYSSSTYTRCCCLYILGVPTKPSTSVNKTPSVGGSATFTCNSTSTTIPSNHSLSLVYSWKVDNSDNPSASRYTYSTDRSILTLSGIVKEDASKHFTCTARENVADGHTSNSSESLTLNVIYGPDNHTLGIQSPFIVTEGDVSRDIKCLADCYPACSYSWTNVTSGSTISLNSILLLATVNRHMTGSYICKATNTADEYRKSINAAVTIIVQYAPEVKIKVSTANVSEGARINLLCTGYGIPSIYTYTGFTHTVNGIVVPNNNTAMPGTDPLSSVHFPFLQLQDTGTYTCTLNNGVKDTSGSLDQTSAVTIAVEVLPKLLLEEVRFAGVPGGDIHINLPVYSFPELQTAAITRYDGINMSSYYNCNITTYNDAVRTRFYGQSVSLNGSVIIMVINELAREDFGNYSVKLTNTLGSVTFGISIIKEEDVESSTSSLTLPIAAGVSSFVTLVVAFGFSIIIWRKRVKNTEHHRGAQQTDNFAVESVVSAFRQLKVDQPEPSAADPTKFYEHLRGKDEGSAHYSELTLTTPVTNDSGVAYENLKLENM